MTQPARATLVCPRCSGPMVTLIRAGVQIDQCENCKGIFLDRGELERLVEAEQSYYQQPGYQQVPQQPGYQQVPGYSPQPGYDYDGEHHGEHHGEHDDEHHGSRRRGFMHDLFG